MCTSIAFRNKNMYFGRNMDIEYSFGERIVTVPRNYEFRLSNGEIIKRHPAIIGMATVVDNYPLFADAMNEAGLCMAGLNFPGNARYFASGDISPYEFIPYVLCKYKKVSEVKEGLKDSCLSDIPFSDKMPLADLHFMISDEKESIVIEQDKDGFHIYDNPIDVMTNNPIFPMQCRNLSFYRGLSVENPKDNENFAGYIKDFPKTDAVGYGQFGLPGDATAASRFVRAAFNMHVSKNHISEDESVSQVFHILDSVKFLKGAVITNDGKEDITSYSACLSAKDMAYFYTVYNNRRINAVYLRDEDMDGDEIKEYSLNTKEDILKVN